MLSREKLAAAVGDRWSADRLNAAVELLTRADGRFPAGVRTLPRSWSARSSASACSPR